MSEITRHLYNILEAIRNCERTGNSHYINQSAEKILHDGRKVVILMPNHQIDVAIPSGARITTPENAARDTVERDAVILIEPAVLWELASNAIAEIEKQNKEIKRLKDIVAYNV